MLAADVTNFNARMGVAVPMPTVVVPPTGIDPGAACSTSTCDATLLDYQSEATLDVERAGSIAAWRRSIS